jgi:hypothetical protein
LGILGPMAVDFYMPLFFILTLLYSSLLSPLLAFSFYKLMYLLLGRRHRFSINSASLQRYTGCAHINTPPHEAITQNSQYPRNRVYIWTSTFPLPCLGTCRSSCSFCNWVSTARGRFPSFFPWWFRSRCSSWALEDWHKTNMNSANTNPILE